MGDRWYVIQTKTGKEGLSLQELRNQGFNVFCPYYAKANKNIFLPIRKAPLFPNYLFVLFDKEENDYWKSIKYTRGVLKIVACSEDFVVPVKVGCVEALIELTNNDGLIELPSAIERMLMFTEGKLFKVSQENGPDIIGSYCNHTENRVTLLLTLLSKPIKVNFPIDKVTPYVGDDQR